MAGPRIALYVVVVACAAAGHGRAEPLRGSFAQSLSFDNNITLLARDVNFGPAQLSRDDVLLGHRLELDKRSGHARYDYTFTRTHFFENEHLHFFHHALRGSWEVPGRKDSYYRLAVEYDKFDPDHRAVADVSGRFPFTTTERPNRRMYSALLNQVVSDRDRLEVQGVDQSTWYTNNPVLDTDASGYVLRWTHRLNGGFVPFVEGGGVSRRYRNLGDRDGDPRRLRTPQDHVSIGVTHVPSSRSGTLLKFTRLEQDANIRAFELDEWAASLASAYHFGKGTWAVLTAQRSHRIFNRRRVARGSGPQDDRQHVVTVQLTHPIEKDVRVLVSVLRDRNESNNREFDYVHRIGTIEIQRSC